MLTFLCVKLSRKAQMNTPKTVFTLKKVSRLNRLKSTGDTVRESYTQPIVNKKRKRSEGFNYGGSGQVY